MLSKFSVKKPYTVIVAVILVIVLGVISFANMTTDLLPNMDLPYVAVYTTYIGATPEQVESDITRPMEASFATLPGIDSINSTSSENLSLVIMEFESGVDMNSVMIELSSQLDMLRGSWDDAVGAPVVMQIDPNMLPVSIASVSLEGADVHELTDFVEGEILPRLEGIDGVASVSVSGAVEETVARRCAPSGKDTSPRLKFLAGDALAGVHLHDLSPGLFGHGAGHVPRGHLDDVDGRDAVLLHSVDEREATACTLGWDSSSSRRRRKRSQGRIRARSTKTGAVGKDQFCARRQRPDRGRSGRAGTSSAS